MANVYYTLYYGNGKEFYIYNGLKSKADLIKKALFLNINSGYFTGYNKDTNELKYYSLELLVNNEPKILGLKELINNFILHRKDIIVKRSKFDLEKARKRVHILEGLKIALKNIDLSVKLIKNSKNVEEAQKSLIKEFDLSDVQAKSILEMRLQRLTSLEQNKLENEYKELLKVISELEIILGSEERVFRIIKEECLELKDKYGDERRTEIIDSEDDFEIEDLIQEEDVIVTMTNRGYVKRVPIYTYKEQKRGGKGVIATGTKEEDFVKELFITNTRDNILFFTDKGKVHWLKGYEIPSGSRYGSGKAIVNLLNLKDESVTTMIPVRDFSEEKYLIMVTEKGFVKRIELDVFSKPRKGGILGIKLVEDKLVDVKLTNGSDELIIGTKKGAAIRFNEKDVRVIGRSGRGVRGIRISKEDIVKREFVDGLLKNIGYDVDKINSCSTSKETNSAVAERRIDLEKTNIYGTPLIFINEKGLVGPKPYRVYERILKGWKFW